MQFNCQLSALFPYFTDFHKFLNFFFTAIYQELNIKSALEHLSHIEPAINDLETKVILQYFVSFFLRFLLQKVYTYIYEPISRTITYIFMLHIYIYIVEHVSQKL